MTHNILSEREYLISLVLITGYLFIQILANLTVEKYTPLTSSLAIPIGSLLYAVSFTWIDLINDYLGKSRARKLVVISICANLFTILWLQLYIHLPGTQRWESDPFSQKAIEFVLGGVWRIYVASLIGSFIVENTDITIFHYVRSHWPKAPRWIRALLSNTVSGPLDAALFSALAFGGAIPLRELWTIILGGSLYKLIIGYLTIPMLYLVRARHERSRPSSTDQRNTCGGRSARSTCDS